MEASMGALSKLFGRPKMTYKGVAYQRPISECCVGHDLMPRWRAPQDMGDDSRAMGFVCHQCGREFLPANVRGRRLIRGDVIYAPAAASPAPAPDAAEDGEADE